MTAAWELYREQGVEQTSVNAVIRRAGLSKGTFYHWFDGPQGLLDAVVDRLLERAESQLVTPVEGTAVERLNAFLRGGWAWRFAHVEIVGAVLRALSDPRNRTLRERMRRRTAAVALPILVDILTQGQREGDFELDAPELVAEMVLRLGHTLSDAQMRDLWSASEGTVDRVVQRAEVHLRWLERGLGLSPGTLPALGRDFRDGVEAYAAYITGEPHERTEP